jgi:hypothetical protein
MSSDRLMEQRCWQIAVTFIFMNRPLFSCRGQVGSVAVWWRIFAGAPVAIRGLRSSQDVRGVVAITLAAVTARGERLMFTVTAWTAECRPCTNVSAKR